MDELPVEILEWDSSFFNRRIANITTNSLSKEEAQKINSWAVDQKVDCIYYLADGNRMDSTSSAEIHGFHFVDLRITLKKDLRKPDKSFLPKIHIRPATLADLEPLKRMVRDTFLYSRFHVDDHFTKSKANELFEVWIEKDLRLKDHSVLVIEYEEQIVSFISYSVNFDVKKAQLGLGTTLEVWRGRGLLLEMLNFFAHQLREEGIEEVEVVTSGRNLPTLHMLQKAGYHLSSIDLWYHKWFDDQ